MSTKTSLRLRFKRKVIFVMLPRPHFTEQVDQLPETHLEGTVWEDSLDNNGL